MIQYNPKNWLSILFRLRGSVLPRMLVRCLIAAVVGVIAVYLLKIEGFRIPSIVHTMIGIALGLLLVFRTNASYDRFWEGRKLLGGMVNRTRDLARQVMGYIPGDDEPTVALRAHLRNLIVAFYRLSCQTLRQERDLNKWASLLTEHERAQLENATHRAPIITSWLTSHCAALAEQGRITQQQLQSIDQNLTALNDLLGGAERIMRTPVPFAYAQHIKIFVVLFCYTAPFAITDSMGWKTPFAAFILAFALFGVDEIGVEIEDPFGYDENDLPLEAIGDGIDVATQDIVRTHVAYDNGIYSTFENTNGEKNKSQRVALYG